jgi:hypothetical protein
MGLCGTSGGTSTIVSVAAACARPLGATLDDCLVCFPPIGLSDRALGNGVKDLISGQYLTGLRTEAPARELTSAWRIVFSSGTMGVLGG